MALQRWPAAGGTRHGRLLLRSTACRRSPARGGGWGPALAARGWDVTAVDQAGHGGRPVAGEVSAAMLAAAVRAVHPGPTRRPHRPQPRDRHRARPARGRARMSGGGDPRGPAVAPGAGGVPGARGRHRRGCRRGARPTAGPSSTASAASARGGTARTSTGPCRASPRWTPARSRDGCGRWLPTRAFAPRRRTGSAPSRRAPTSSPPSASGRCSTAGRRWPRPTARPSRGPVSPPGHVVGIAGGHCLHRDAPDEWLAAVEAIIG